MSDSSAAAGALVHPLPVRLTHWINALAMLVMLTSGWRIYNAAPLFGFVFPPELTLGGWLAGALQWHFAAMWLLVLNGLVYAVYGLATGHFRSNLRPPSLRAVGRDLARAVSGGLVHRPGRYNAVQRVAYTGILVVGALLVLSGLALWKPVQLQELAALMGGYEGARSVHFAAMAASVVFIGVHLLMVVRAPGTLRPMLTGRAPAGGPEA